MADSVKTAECRKNCLLIGTIVGAVVAALLFMLAGWTFTQSLFAGVVAAIITGYCLNRFYCDQSGVYVAASDPAQAMVPAPKAVGTIEVVPADSAVNDIKADIDTPTADILENNPESSENVDIVEPEEIPEAEKPVAAPVVETKPVEAEQSPRAPVAEDGKPELFAKPREGGADDLKRISGVGPKLESVLNEMGVWHFDQVAGWRQKEIEWVDQRLTFKGRIVRDNWMSQAKVLAKGGGTEFSTRKKK